MKRSLFFLLLVAALGSPAFAAPYISEVMANNDTTLADEDDEFPDWIEIHNPDATAVNLEGYFLTDNAEDLEKWEFPAISIPADGYLLIFASGKNRDNPAARLHTGFRLGSGGEYLALVNTNGTTVVNEIAPTYPPLEGDQSYIAVESEDTLAYSVTDNPTPGESNETNIVVFSLKGQSFTDSLTLELTSPSGGAIRYTTNGRTPTLFNGRNYTGPITIDQSVLIAARVGSGPFRTEAFFKVDPALADTSSNIPLVVIDTFGNSVPNAESTTLEEMAIAVIEPGGDDARSQLLGEFNLSSLGGIRKRGESSSGFPKFPLRIEFHGPDGEDQDASPLGLPAHSDWVLNARYTFDRALIRNAWIYELSNQIDSYAPRTRFVEVYLNDDNNGTVDQADYMGVYTLVENIRRGNRVEVSRLDVAAAEEPEITGGYLFKFDKPDPGTWNFSGGGLNLQMVYPSESEKDQRGHQQAYLQEFLNEMRTATASSDPETGYPAYINPEKWIDHQMLNVMTLNVDGLRLSAYFSKDREGKVSAGPIWDFDRSAGSTDGRSAPADKWRRPGTGDQGTTFFTNVFRTPVWWDNLFEQPDFMNDWVDRWYELREDEFSVENIHAIIDSMGNELTEAAERNFDKWSSVRPRGGSYQAEIDLLKDWMAERVEWMDSELIPVPTFEPTDLVQGDSAMVTLKAKGTLFNPARIYYTTDGSDPRASGGDPSATATLYASPFEITSSTVVRARRFDPNHKTDDHGPTLEWSGMGEIRYFVGAEPASADNLVISELMYNPGDLTGSEKAAGFNDEDAFEYIEFRNVGPRPIDLFNVDIESGIGFEFEEGTILPVGATALLVSDPDAFALRYGSDI
ncbi:MAG: CotH kinase family protein, partial [Verrucomicrobiota bacterium]